MQTSRVFEMLMMLILMAKEIYDSFGFSFAGSHFGRGTLFLPLKVPKLQLRKLSLEYCICVFIEYMVEIFAASLGELIWFTTKSFPLVFSSNT